MLPSSEVQAYSEGWGHLSQCRCELFPEGLDQLSCSSILWRSEPTVPGPGKGRAGSAHVSYDSVLTLAMNITTDPDMALGSSLGPDAIMTSVAARSPPPAAAWSLGINMVPGGWPDSRHPQLEPWIPPQDPDMALGSGPCRMSLWLQVKKKKISQLKKFFNDF